VHNESKQYFHRETFLRKNWDKNGTLLVLTFAFSSDIMNISERSEFKIKELVSIERI